MVTGYPPKCITVGCHRPATTYMGRVVREYHCISHAPKGSTHMDGCMCLECVPRDVRGHYHRFEARSL
jgi:hypothetical protein